MLMVNEHVAFDLELKRHYHIVLKALNLGFINKKTGEKHLHFKRISGASGNFEAVMSGAASS